MEDQIRRTNNWIHKTKKSNLDCPSGPVAQKLEALNLYASRWALSEDSGFHSYPSRSEGFLVKNMVLAIKHLKTARGEIWPKRSEKNNNNY